MRVSFDGMSFRVQEMEGRGDALFDLKSILIYGKVMARRFHMKIIFSLGFLANRKQAVPEAS